TGVPPKTEPCSDPSDLPVHEQILTPPAASPATPIPAPPPQNPAATFTADRAPQEFPAADSRIPESDAVLKLIEQRVTTQPQQVSALSTNAGEPLMFANSVQK